MIPCFRFGLFLCLVLSAALQAAEPSASDTKPRIALIIDDLGNELSQGEAALRLPGSVTYAFLPHTPYAPRLASRAYELRKQVMLHLPMESVQGKRLGPGGLSRAMDESAIQGALAEAIASVPHSVGINNHMGSLLTVEEQPMRWLMEALDRYPGMFFVDSRTTADSLAEEYAERAGLASARRDVFLDHDRDPATIRFHFQRLLELARQRGSAIGIAHPYPETLLVLAELLPQLADQGLELVPVSRLTETDPRRKPWRVSSSPLPKVAKNSKRLP